MNYDAKIDTENEEPASYDPLAGADEEDRLSRRRMWIVAVAAAAVLIGLWFMLHTGGSSELEADGIRQAPVVSVIAPGRQNITAQINATGTLAARRELPVGSVGDGGQVRSVLVEPGQWVKAGQPLAIIDRSVQTQQQASLAAQIQVAQADARLAQANLDRALKLVDRGFISTADVDRLTATRDAAVARIGVARAQLGEMQARTQRLNIVAPSAGLVLERKVEPGQVVTTGTGVLFRIAKGGEMEMLAELGETDLARVSIGATAQVTPVGSNTAVTGQVWQVSPVIDPQTRQGQVRIALSYAPQLRPGGFARAQITGGSAVASMLPESAVLFDNKGHYVYVIDKDNKVRRRDVVTGNITDNGIVITKGLTGKEQVVLRAGAFLAPGETVKVAQPKTPQG